MVDLCSRPYDARISVMLGKPLGSGMPPYAMRQVMGKCRKHARPLSRTDRQTREIMPALQHAHASNGSMV